jgi:hypothetical protein
MSDLDEIVIRDGPAGPRPGLARGPDIWEVVSVHRSFEDVRKTAHWLGLATDAVEAALGYYDAHRAEIDNWIRVNEEAAALALREAERGR